jgi:uncharacterized membrane protein (DUF4010 family)
VLEKLVTVVPRQALEMGLVLALAFFVGLEREEHKQAGEVYAFGGVRTFPLIGLVSYTLALLTGASVMPWALGFAVMGGLMMLSYRHKLATEPTAGLTTEVSALATYVLGGLVERQYYWIATTLGVLSVLLLELKKGLEGLTQRVASHEIVTVAKFLVLAAVILPIVPDHDIGRFHVNPFKTWVVVVAVSGVSFASYVLQKVLRQRGGVMVSALLGGAYSSTVTTVVLARHAKQQKRPSLYAGSILTASGVMYARLVLLLAFFDPALALHLAPTFVTLAVGGTLAGWLVARRDHVAAKTREEGPVKNPLELRSAFLFALVFVVVIVLTTVAREHLGKTGLYALAAILGVTDVDPFILGIAQRGHAVATLHVAAAAIVIAAASNNVIKAFYAWGFADRETGRKSLALLLGLAAAGIVPLVWV